MLFGPLVSEGFLFSWDRDFCHSHDLIALLILGQTENVWWPNMLMFEALAKRFKHVLSKKKTSERKELWVTKQ